MTPEQMDELYPRMNPLMSRLISDATSWLSGSWSADELLHGKRLVIPLDEARGRLMVDHFSKQGWDVDGVYGPANVLLTFHVSDPQHVP